MGCYPLGKMVSKVIRKCKEGERRHGADTTMVYSPPPTYSYARSMPARHVTFASDTPTVILPPESAAHMIPPVPKHHHHHHHETAAAVSPSPPQPEPPQPREQPSRVVRFNPAPGPPDDAPPSAARPPKPAKVKFTAAAAAADHHPGHGGIPYQSGRGEAAAAAAAAAAAGPSRTGAGNEPAPTPVYSAGGGAGYRYMTSPLPRWEEGGDRRREYFSGEYHYYPTPVRDGIYRIATDANRLTTIFSEENPNACSIA